MTIDEFVKKALLVPFKEKGRDYESWDCYGLVHCGMRDVFGVELPEYLNYSTTRDYKALKTMIDEAKPLWKEVDKPQAGDVALYHLPGKICHVAFVVDKKRALHAEEKIGTFIEKIKSVVWGRKLEGIYRLNEQ